MLKFPKLASVAITGNKGRTFLIDHSALFQDKIHPIIPRGLGQGGGEEEGGRRRVSQRRNLQGKTAK